MASRRFLRGERIDMQAVTDETGLARATLYRWFGSREGLLGSMLVQLGTPIFEAARVTAAGRGAPGLLDAFDSVSRTLSDSEPLRHFLEYERYTALRILTSSAGAMQRTSIAYATDLIAAEVDTGRFQTRLDPRTLAYAVVWLTEAFLYNDAAIGLRGETDRLREVIAALLGIEDSAAPTRAEVAVA